MSKYECRHCKYTTTLSPQDADFGMMCPECYAGNLRPVDRGRSEKAKRNRVVQFRPVTIRTLIGGGLLTIGGLFFLMTGFANQRRGFGATRSIIYGIAMTIFGVIALGSGGYMLYEDLKFKG